MTFDILVQVASSVAIAAIAYGTIRQEVSRLRADLTDFKTDVRKDFANGNGVFPRLNRLEQHVAAQEALCKATHGRRAEDAVQ
jgi:hypothetical protein